MLRLTCPGRIDPLHRHLAPGSRCGSTVYHAVSWPQEAKLVIDLQQLEGASAPEVLGARRFHVRVSELPLQPAVLGGTFTFCRLHQTQRRVKRPRLKVDAPHSFWLLAWHHCLCTNIKSCVQFGRTRLRGKYDLLLVGENHCASHFKSPLQTNCGQTVPLRAYLRLGWNSNCKYMHLWCPSFFLNGDWNDMTWLYILLKLKILILRGKMAEICSCVYLLKLN